MSPLAVGLINMELNRGDGSLGTFLGVQAGLAMQSIAMLGSEEQKQRWLPGDGPVETLGAFALTEPTHGSDSVALETSARRDGDTLGDQRAEEVDRQRHPRRRRRASGPATRPTARSRASWSRRAPPATTRRRIDGKGSLRAIWQAEITLTDVRVPESNRLPGANSFKDAGRGAGRHPQRGGLGGARPRHRGLRDRRWPTARQRTQFGKPLVSFQIVQDRLVKMLAEVCSMQLYCLQLGRLQEQGSLTDTIAAIAKMNNTRKAREVIAEARDLLGGNGILLDYHVMRHMADIEALHTYEGTETIQTLIVGRDITGVGAFA